MWRVARCTGHVLKFAARLYCHRINTEKIVLKAKLSGHDTLQPRHRVSFPTNSEYAHTCRMNTYVLAKSVLARSCGEGKNVVIAKSIVELVYIGTI